LFFCNNSISNNSRLNRPFNNRAAIITRGA